MDPKDIADRFITKQKITDLTIKALSGVCECSYLGIFYREPGGKPCRISKMDRELIVLIKEIINYNSFLSTQDALKLPSDLLLKIISYTNEASRDHSDYDKIIYSLTKFKMQIRLEEYGQDVYPYIQIDNDLAKKIINWIVQSLHGSDYAIKPLQNVLFANIMTRLRANVNLVDTQCRIAMLDSPRANSDFYKFNFLPAFKQVAKESGTDMSSLQLKDREKIYARAEQLTIKDDDALRYNAIGTAHFKKALSLS